MGYSLENAKKFGWGSVTGNLSTERVSHLEKYLLGQRILDAGCAGGAYASFFTRKGFQVAGIDRHAPFIHLARENEQGGRWLQGDLTCLPFASKIFDCTYCFDVLEHVDDHLAIQELARVTTGRLILTVPQEDALMSRYNLTFLHYRDTTHLRYYTETSLRELVSTIKYSRLIVFPELAIPLRILVAELVKFNLGVLARFEIKLLRLKTRIQEMLNSGNLNAASFQGTEFELFLDMQKFKIIYSGLVAVVDL